MKSWHVCIKMITFLDGKLYVKTFSMDVVFIIKNKYEVHVP